MAADIRTSKIFGSRNVKDPKGKQSPCVIALSFTKDVYCVRLRELGARLVNRGINLCFISHSHFCRSLPI